MTIAQQIIKAAKAELGVMEQPPGLNRGPYVLTDYYAPLNGTRLSHPDQCGDCSDVVQGQRGDPVRMLAVARHFTPGWIWRHAGRLAENDESPRRPHPSCRLRTNAWSHTRWIRTRPPLPQSSLRQPGSPRTCSQAGEHPSGARAVRPLRSADALPPRTPVHPREHPAATTVRPRMQDLHPRPSPAALLPAAIRPRASQGDTGSEWRKV